MDGPLDRVAQALGGRRVGNDLIDVGVIVADSLVGYYLTVNVVALELWTGHVGEVLIARPCFSTGCHVLGCGVVKLINLVGWCLGSAALDHVVNGPLDRVAQILSCRRVGNDFIDVRVIVGDVFVGYDRTIDLVALDGRTGNVREVLVSVPGFRTVDALSAKAQLINPVGWRLRGAALDHVVDGPLDRVSQRYWYWFG